MNEKSLLFETLSEKSINLITEKHFYSDVSEVRLLKGGLFNTTYSIELKSNSKKYVLQIGPVRQHLLLPMELHLFQAEQYVCELLEESSIPSNHVTAYNFKKDIIDREYIIFDFIKGTVLDDKSIKRKNKKQLCIEAGELTKKIHFISGNYYGRISNQFRNITHKTWNSYLQFEIQELKENCIKYQVFSLDAFDEIQALFKKGKPYFDTVTTPHLVHGDLWSGNIMVNEEHSRIAAIIDTDRCMFGDPDMDLANNWMINKSFLLGYGEIVSNRNREIKLLYYKLFYAIIDAYVWKTEYSNNSNYNGSYKTVKNLVKKINRYL